MSMLLTARLLSLRGPSPTAAAVTIGSIKAEVFDSPSRAAERENSFLQAAESAAATLSLTLQSKHRGDWTAQQANAKIAELLAEGFAGRVGAKNTVPAPAATDAAPAASSSSWQ